MPSAIQINSHVQSTIETIQETVCNYTYANVQCEGVQKHMHKATQKLYKNRLAAIPTQTSNVKVCVAFGIQMKDPTKQLSAASVCAD